MPSALPLGLELQVNTFTTGAQGAGEETGRGLATDAQGNFVVVWSSNGQDGSGTGVFGQRFDATGTAIGGEFQVNSYTTGNQRRASVAMDADGDFVVVWESFGQDGNYYGVYAQRYNATGVAQGCEFKVSGFTVGYQHQAQVAMDDAGNFVVTWTDGQFDPGGFVDVVARRYAADGSALGSEFRVNTYATRNQWYSSVAMDADGDFVVTWQSRRPAVTGYQIYAQRFTSAGIAAGSEFRVSPVAVVSNQQKVVMNQSGAFVVAWNSGGSVLAQSFQGDGTPRGSELVVSDIGFEPGGVQAYGFDPAVTMDDDGSFVVAMAISNRDGSGAGVYGRRYTADRFSDGSAFRINSYTTSMQRAPMIASDGDGSFVVAWESLGQDGSSYGIYARRYDAKPPTVTDIQSSGNTLADNDVLVAPLATVTVVFSEELSTVGGASGPNSVTNPANWSLRKNGVDVSGQIQSVSFGLNGVTGQYEAVVTFSAPLTTGDYELVATGAGGITDLAGLRLDGDANGTPGGDFLRRFGVREDGPTFDDPPRVTGVYANGTRLDEGARLLLAPNGSNAVAALTVTFTENMDQFNVRDNWQLLRDGVNVPINDVALMLDGTTGLTNVILSFTPELGIGDYTLTLFDGATDLVGQTLDGDYDLTPCGDFVLNFSIRITQTTGPEFRVNSYTTGSQATISDPRGSVAVDSAGNYVVVWTSDGQDGSGQGVYAQRYAANGTRLGNEFRVNGITALSQHHAKVAMDAAGNFVVVWQQELSIGSNVMGQRFAANGTRLGLEFRLASTVGTQDVTPSISMKSDGDFVVTWVRSNGPTLSVYSRIFDAAGVPAGDEIQVELSADSAFHGDVAVNETGEFVVTWAGGPVGTRDVFAQRFSADGDRVGATFRVNTGTTQDQLAPSIAVDAEGDFVITWTDYGGQDGDSYGVYAQRYRADGTAFGGQFRVNDQTTSRQFASDVAIDATGNLLVTWSAERTSGAWDVRARQYGPDGQSLGESFLVNTYTTASQGYSSTGVNAAGDFVVAWSSNGQDGSSYGVYAQRYIGGRLPTITPSVFAISENRPHGYDVGNVIATNPDAGQALTYSIVGGNTGNAFAINAATGRLTVNNVPAINFELNPTFALTVRVADSQNPLTFTEQAITINLNDLNEAPAPFSRSFTIAENRPNGFVLGNVTTTDQDMGQTLSYSLTGGNTGNAFAINASTGQLAVANAAALDFESNPTFTLQVTATDNGSPQNSRTGTVTVQLTDLDEPPDIFPQTFTISENRPQGYVVGTVVAHEQDANEILAYSIIGGNPNVAFSINPFTGLLRVNNVAMMNYELNPTFSLIVEVTDSQAPNRSTTATITVNLTDLNEAPTASNQTIGVIAENSPNGTVVGTFLAFDPDAGQSLSYSLIGGNTDNAFAINASTGKVTVNNSVALDFETTPQFNLQVQVTDNGNPTQTRVGTAIVKLVDQPESSAVILARPSSSRTSRSDATSPAPLSGEQQPTAVSQTFEQFRFRLQRDAEEGPGRMSG